MKRSESTLTPGMRGKPGSFQNLGSFDFALDATSQPSPSASSDTPHSFLGAALDDRMATPASVKYRAAYQRHRRGGAHGAAGEGARDDADADEAGGSSSQLLLEEALGGGGVHGAGEMYDNEKGFHQLLKWRLSYQAHRSGASRGARGEIGSGLDVQDVRMLPVARLAAHKHQMNIIAARLARPRSSKDRLSSLREESSEHAAREQPVAAAQPAAAAARPCHVHVGAGRLGLGLVLPALARSARERKGTLVVLQRPSGAWAALEHGSAVAFTINQQPVCRLRVLRSASAELAAWKAGEADDDAPDGLLVLSEDEAVLDDVARATTSLSTSLGPALGTGLAPLLAALRRAEADGSADAADAEDAPTGAARKPPPRLRLYAAENDHAAVAKLAATPELLGGLEGLPIKTIPLLVDRVCTDRTIVAGQVDTQAEPWGGEIVVMTPPAGDDDDEPGSPHEGESPGAARRRLLAAPPFSGEGVRWPKSEAEAHFLHRRKILTVNGTHTTLAFHTLAVHEPPPHMGLPAGDYELLRAIAADGKEGDEGAEEEEADDDAALQVEETYRMAWSWVVARQLMLLYESDADVAAAALGCERDDAKASEKALADALLAGARVALRRLGRGGDTTKRVLGGGVVNRFQTRLKPIASFLDASAGGSASSRWLRGSLPRLLLRRAKLTETTMRLAVLGLAADAERFTVDTKASEVDKAAAATPKPSPAKQPKPQPPTPDAKAAALPASVAA